jgi:hypothetical protein
VLDLAVSLSLYRLSLIALAILLPAMQIESAINSAALSPNDHPEFYDDVQGMSEARPRPERPKEPQPLPLRVRRCCGHPEDDDCIELGAFGIHN